MTSMIGSYKLVMPYPMLTVLMVLHGLQYMLLRVRMEALSVEPSLIQRWAV